jgi:hypothetical protein
MASNLKYGEVIWRAVAVMCSVSDSRDLAPRGTHRYRWSKWLLKRPLRKGRTSNALALLAPRF